MLWLATVWHHLNQSQFWPHCPSHKYNISASIAVIPAPSKNILITGVQGGVDCKDKEDGVYGWGCKAFTYCKGGKGKEVFCTGTSVYNPETEGCDEYISVASPHA